MRRYGEVEVPHMGKRRYHGGNANSNNTCSFDGAGRIYEENVGGKNAVAAINLGINMARTTVARKTETMTR